MHPEHRLPHLDAASDGDIAASDAGISAVFVLKMSKRLFVLLVSVDNWLVPFCVLWYLPSLSLSMHSLALCR